MKRFLISLFAFLALPNVVHGSHLYNQKELIVTSESTKESIELAKYLMTMFLLNIQHIGDLIAPIKVNYLVSKLIGNLM